MTAKQYLGQIRRLDILIHNEFSELYDARSMATNISVLFKDDKVQTSGSQDRMGDMIAICVDVEKECESYISQYWNLKRVIISQINSIPKETYSKLLYERYVDCKTFDMIADDLGYSWRQTIRIHGDALQDFERRFGSEFEKDVIECHINHVI